MTTATNLLINDTLMYLNAILIHCIYTLLFAIKLALYYLLFFPPWNCIIFIINVIIMGLREAFRKKLI